MSRTKRDFNAQEVEEIILSKLNGLGGIKKKLTYNGVFEHNKMISNNQDYKRFDGELFTLYGYDFWAGSYKGDSYLGKKRIDEIKNSSNILIAGEEFSTDMQDIITLVNDYYKKPEVLSKRLLKLFERDRNKIKIYEKELEKSTKQIASLNERLELLEKGIVSLFYNSSTSYNSLENLMSMSRPKDGIIYEELKNMFNSNESRLKALINGGESPEKPKLRESIINIEDVEKARVKRRENYEDKI